MNKINYNVIADHYNAAIRGVAHCHPISAATMESELRAESERFSVQELFSSDHGYIHVAIRSDKHGRPGSPAAIRFFAFSAGRHHDGIDLIRRAEEWSREQEAPDIRAFYQGDSYGFYHSSSACLSDKMGHIQALLQVSGYHKSRGEVFLDIDDFNAAALPDLDPCFSVKVEEKKTDCTLPSYTIRIFDGKEIAGECQVSSREAFGGFKEESHRLFYSWVGVEEAYQRRGLGKYLVNRALHEGLRIGYRHASISTAWDNDRAFVLYANEGFRVVDWTYGWSKPL